MPTSGLRDRGFGKMSHLDPHPRTLLLHLKGGGTNLTMKMFFPPIGVRQ